MKKVVLVLLSLTSVACSSTHVDHRYTKILMTNGRVAGGKASVGDPFFRKIHRQDHAGSRTTIVCSEPGSMPVSRMIANSARGVDEHSQTDEAACNFAWSRIEILQMSGDQLFSVKGLNLQKRLSWSVSVVDSLLSGYIVVWEADSTMP